MTAARFRIVEQPLTVIPVSVLIRTQQVTRGQGRGRGSMSGSVVAADGVVRR
jgi:hypothetical protein